MRAVDEAELGRKEIAEIFQVSTRFITKLICQRNELGHVAPLSHGGSQPALFDEEDKERLKKAVAERPDISFEELSQAVHPGRRKDKKASITTISRVLKKLGLPREKKTFIPAEADPEKRAEFRGKVESLPASRFTFIDETGINVDMARRYGRAAPGERVVEKLPRNTPLPITVIGTLTAERLKATMEIEGSVNKAVFEAYVEQVLVLRTP